MSSADVMKINPKWLSTLNYTMAVEDSVSLVDSRQKVIERPQPPSIISLTDDLAAMADKRDALPRTEGLGVKMKMPTPIPSMTASMDKLYMAYKGKRKPKK